jgi:excisionase family DNA binding protein
MLSYPIADNPLLSFPEVLTPEEAADYLRVDRETVYRRLRAGQLPGNKVGQQWRIRKHDLNEYLQGPRS